MSWTLNITKITGGARGEALKVFGSIAFAGAYTAGGDPTGTFAMGSGVGNWPDWFPTQSALHAGGPPIDGLVDLDGGYRGKFVMAASPTGPIPSKLQIYSAAGTELTAANYPAAILTTFPNHTFTLEYKSGGVS